VPEITNPQAFNRYSWVLGNPLKFVDPTGHRESGECGYNGEACSDDPLPTWTWAQFLKDTLTFNIFDVGMTGEVRPTTQINAQIQAGYAKVTDFVRSVTPAPVLKVLDDLDQLLSQPEIQWGIQAAMMTTGAPPNPELMSGGSASGAEVIKRAFRNPQDMFLRSGEEGLSVLIGAPEELVQQELQGTVRTVTAESITDLGLTVDKTPGAIESLEPYHYEIRPGPGMSRGEFKKRIKQIPWE
jgi:hypothetical protein